MTDKNQPNKIEHREPIYIKISTLIGLSLMTAFFIFGHFLIGVSMLGIMFTVGVILEWYGYSFSDKVLKEQTKIPHGVVYN